VETLCSWDREITQNAIEVYVSRLRAKLEAEDVRIRTVRGFGYLLAADDSLGVSTKN
jgi:two-component system OmpR family response regulator